MRGNRIDDDGSFFQGALIGGVILAVVAGFFWFLYHLAMVLVMWWKLRL